jgi:K+-transporting ATPase ATPase C chain
MLNQLRPALVLVAFFTLLTGLVYPLVVTGMAQALFPVAANGSLLEEDGVVRGSSLIGQNFVREDYFHGRPSAVAYNASTSSGSNLAPSSAALLEQVRQRAGAYGGSNVPADLLTASGSGLDPDISPEAALVQVPRVAAARTMPEAKLRALIDAHTQERDLGILGARRVNVLALNRALDAGKP